MPTNRISEWLQVSDSVRSFGPAYETPFAAIPLAFFPAAQQSHIAAIYEAALERTRKQFESARAWNVEFSVN